jgi:hypothetical protein
MRKHKFWWGKRIIIILDKMWREGVKRLSKTLRCAAARAANVYNYKAQRRVAGEPAVSKVDFTTGSHF